MCCPFYVFIYTFAEILLIADKEEQKKWHMMLTDKVWVVASKGLNSSMFPHLAEGRRTRCRRRQWSRRAEPCWGGSSSHCHLLSQQSRQEPEGEASCVGSSCGFPPFNG